ncbi:ABC transporter permease [Spirochaetota bacterium]
MTFIRKNIIISMVRKEFKQIMRDVKMRGIMFVAPVLMLVIFGYAATIDVKNINLAVFDEDKTRMSREIIEKFLSSGYFVYTASLKSPKDINYLFDTGKADLYIHIRKGLSKNIKKGKTESIQILIDGMDSSRASIIMAYVNEIINKISMKKLLERIRSNISFKMSSARANSPNSSPGFKLKNVIELKERILFNQALLSRNFYLPGVIALLISLITILLTSMSIVKERESGTIDQIIVSPIKPIEYILGKTVPFAIVGVIDICIVSLITIFWFNVPFNGNFIFLLVAGLFYILSTLAVGLFISTISRTQQQAMLTFFLFLMPATIFSGFIFPINAMPFSMQVITYFNPLRYFFIIIRGVFLKGTGIITLWPEMMFLLLIGSILIFLSARRFSKRLE